MYKAKKYLPFLVLVTIICILTVTILITSTTKTSPNRIRSINGWIPYWNQTTAFTSVKNNQKVFNEISPFWYDATKNGDIKALNNSEDPKIINYAQNENLTLTPLISNEFSSSLISTIVNNPVLMQNHIQNIVNKAISQNYSGLDLDYENILPSDKEAFTIFVQKLAKALHEKNKLLYVTLAPKTTATEYPGQDDKAIGEAADKVRIMAYDYSCSTSGPGPIAPVDWVNNVISYTTSVINPNKIELGIPDYGYNWSGSKGIGIDYLQAINTAARYSIKVTNDPKSGPHYTYSDKKGHHTVWFENEASIQPLLDLVNKYDLNGISIWSLGGEDPKIYTVINGKFP